MDESFAVISEDVHSHFIFWTILYFARYVLTTCPSPSVSGFPSTGYDALFSFLLVCASHSRRHACLGLVRWDPQWPRPLPNTIPADLDRNAPLAARTNEYTELHSLADGAPNPLNLSHLHLYVIGLPWPHSVQWLWGLRIHSWMIQSHRALGSHSVWQLVVEGELGRSVWMSWGAGVGYWTELSVPEGCVCVCVFICEGIGRVPSPVARVR